LRGETVHLRDYLRVIRKRRHAALLFFAVVMLIVVLVTFTSTTKFIATTKLLIEKVEPYSIIEYRYVAHDPEFYTTQYQLIRSRPVAEKVVSSMLKDPVSAASLKNEFTYKPGLLARIFGSTPSKDVNPEVWRGTAVKVISSAIIVEPIRGTKIVQVRFVSTNPKFAAILVNRIAEAYIEALLDMRMHSSGMTLQWIGGQINDERDKLEKSERVLQEYMRDSDIITIENKLAVLPQKLSELSIQLTRAEAKRKEFEGLSERLNSIPESLEGADSMPVISEDPIVSSLKIHLIESERKMNELSKKYGPKHPELRDAVNDVNILRQQLNQEIRRVIASVEEGFKLAKINEKKLTELLNESKQEALEVNEKFIQYGVLERDVETNRKIFESLLKRMGEQSINEEIQSVKVFHLEKAETPRRPYSPRKTLNMIVGLLIGTLGGIGCAFFMEYFDNTVKSPDEIEEKYGIPVIGMVSLLKSKGKDGDDKRIETIVMDEPKAAISESFKALRTAIMLSSAESPPRSLLVTSMGPEEGKTSTSINLALAVSRFHKKVLVLDCDLRKPRIHKIFGIDNSKGLSTYLAGDDMDVITELADGGLSVVTSGPIPPDPSELLGSKRFDTFISNMSEKFDLIICDSPPVMSVSDALVLASKMEGTVIVARAGKATHDMLSKGLKALSDVTARIVGILINAIEVRKGDYYYYKYYNNYYSYEYSEENKEGH